MSIDNFALALLRLIEAPETAQRVRAQDEPFQADLTEEESALLRETARDRPNLAEIHRGHEEGDLHLIKSPYQSALEYIRRNLDHLSPSVREQWLRFVQANFEIPENLEWLIGHEERWFKISI
jgi:hypothetical protein